MDIFFNNTNLMLTAVLMMDYFTVVPTQITIKRLLAHTVRPFYTTAIFKHELSFKLLILKRKDRDFSDFYV